MAGLRQRSRHGHDDAVMEHRAGHALSAPCISRFRRRNDRGSLPMPNAPKLGFATIATPTKGVLIVLADEGLHLGAATREALEPAGDLVARAAAAERFRGKSGSTLDIVVPAGLKVSRLVVIGIGKDEARDFVKLGGV